MNENELFVEQLNDECIEAELCSDGFVCTISNDEDFEKFLKMMF